MFKKQPSESDRIRNLFEQNTIRKSGDGPSEPITLSLPDPIEGAPALKPYRRPENTRPVLLPFKKPEPGETRQRPESEARGETRGPSLPSPVDETQVPASSHAVARLNRMFELKSPEAAPAEPVKPAPVAPVARESSVKDSPELQSRLRKTQLRLKAVQILLRVSQPLGDRLKEIAALMCESFSLWQVQIHLPVAHRPEQLEVLGSYTRGGTPRLAKPGSDVARMLQRAFKEGKEQTCRLSESQHLLLALAHRSERLGVLEAVFSPAHSLSADDQLTLKTLSEEIAFYLAEEQKQDNARALSDKDTLTGLLNHRAFQQRLEEALKPSHLQPVSLILADLDFFRQINEVHGYTQGDQVLRQIASLLARQLGEDIPLARFGGEEFALLLTETSLDTALELAAGLRQAIACEKISGKFNSSLGVTASLGVASLNELKPKARQTLLEQACSALAQAKEKGRNQVQAYSPPAEAEAPKAAVRPAMQPQAPVARPAVQPSAPPAQPVRPTAPQQAAPIKKEAPSEPVVARKWSELLADKQAAISEEWQRQTEDYAVPEVSNAVGELRARQQRLVESLCTLLDGKLRISELEQMPLSYFMPSPIVAEIRRGSPKHQLISYEVAFMLLQESLQAVLGKHGAELQDGIDHFFLTINEKLTSLKSELQQGR